MSKDQKQCPNVKCMEDAVKQIQELESEVFVLRQSNHALAHSLGSQTEIIDKQRTELGDLKRRIKSAKETIERWLPVIEEHNKRVIDSNNERGDTIKADDGPLEEGGKIVGKALPDKDHGPLDGMYADPEKEGKIEAVGDAELKWTPPKGNKDE